MWKDSKGDKSYYLCDQRWHTLKISKTARSLRIKVDSLLNMGGGVVDETNSGQINGFMYIGGVKGRVDFFVPYENYNRAQYIGTNSA